MGSEAQTQMQSRIRNVAKDSPALGLCRLTRVFLYQLHNHMG